MAFAVSANDAKQETERLDEAVVWLRQILPDDWTVERSTTQFAGGSAKAFTTDSMITIESPNGALGLLVETKASFSPRDAEQLMSGLARALRGISRTEVLVVADWLSARTRELLRELALNYIDLTGNAYIRTTHPAMFVRTDGANRNPTPASRARSRARGPRAGRLIRTLLDVRPPYTVGSLAEATGLTSGYVSRLLSSLDYEALVERSNAGAVTGVAVEPLLRWWVETYDVIKSNEAMRLLAPAGPEAVLHRLASAGVDAVVTGSFAAVLRRPVTAPALLMIYTSDLVSTRDELELLPSAGSSNVVLLRPYDEVVYERTEIFRGVRYAATTQVAADCLTGPGRMPQEGEAVVEWLNQHETWRADSLSVPTMTPVSTTDAG